MRTDGHNGYQVEPADFKAAALPPGLEPIAARSSRVRRPSQLEEKPKDRYWRQLRELRAAGGFLEHEYPRQNVWIVAQRHFENERIGREFFRELKRTFGQQQKRDSYPRWHFEVLEATCDVHSNIVGPLTMTRAKQLLEYKFEGVTYGQFIDIQQIVAARGGMRGLIGYGAKNPGYLGKELGQKYVLGDGGGEKIRFSEAFRLELLDRGLIEPRKRVYASRALPPRRRIQDAAASTTAPIALPDPVVAPQIELVQLALFHEADAPVIDIRALVEAKRLSKGETQAEAGARIGYMQAGYSNVFVRRHDPLGTYARRRALEYVRAA